MERDGTVGAIFALPTKQETSKPARRARNRRRAKDLVDAKIREIKQAFEIQRSTLEVGQNYLLPRSEAVDAILMHVVDEFHTVRQELTELRRSMGIAETCTGKPFIVARRAA